MSRDGRLTVIYPITDLMPLVSTTAVLHSSASLRPAEKRRDFFKNTRAMINSVIFGFIHDAFRRELYKYAAASLSHLIDHGAFSADISRGLEFRLDLYQHEHIFAHEILLSLKSRASSISAGLYRAVGLRWIFAHVSINK